jgi:hypothetical protein
VKNGTVINASVLLLKVRQRYLARPPAPSRATAPG